MFFRIRLADAAALLENVPEISIGDNAQTVQPVDQIVVELSTDNVMVVVFSFASFDLSSVPFVDVSNEFVELVEQRLIVVDTAVGGGGSDGVGNRFALK